MEINIFKRKKLVSPMPLRIQGIEVAPMTPEPDDAEKAAKAILEIMLAKNAKKKRGRLKPKGCKEGKDKKECADANSVTYYQHLSEHIREAYRVTRQRALRFLCFCEQQLEDSKLPAYGHGSVALLEAELYKRLDIVEREGGDMKKRWQNCLAEVTLRLMNAPLPDDSEDGDGDSVETEKDNA